MVDVNKGRHPVVVAWRRRWNAKSEEGSVADGWAGTAMAMLCK